MAAGSQRGDMEGEVGVGGKRRDAGGQARPPSPHPVALRHYLCDSEHLGALACAAAATLSGDKAKEQLMLGGGAEWIKAQATPHFSETQGSLDWAHVERALHKTIHAARPRRAHRDLRRKLHRTIADLLLTRSGMATWRRPWPPC